jgi:hypothetical protein
MSRITRLRKIPQLLNRKREMERDAERKKKDQERPPFSLSEQPQLKKPRLSAKKKPPAEESKGSSPDGVGGRIDLKV